MSLVSASRSGHHFIHRHLSAAAATTTTISSSVAKTRLRSEFDPDKALSIVSSLPPNPPPSSRFAFDIAVRRLARSRRHSDIHSLLRSRLAGNPADERFISSLILSYGTAGMLDHAIALFDELPSLGSPRTVVSFNALLSAGVKAKRPNRVPDLFSQLSEKHSITPDKISYSILIKSLFLSNKPNQALETLAEMEEKGVEITAITYTAVLDSLYKEAMPEDAEKIWTKMLEEEFVPDLPAYNVRVSYLALHGKPDKVLALMAEMEATGLKPDTITYNYLIACYCKHGQHDEAKKVYKSMNGKGRRPNAATFKKLLACLCEIEDFDWGLGMFKDSVRCNRIPDFRTMRSFVEGLVKASRVEDAKNVIREVKKSFPNDLVGGWKEVEKELGLVM